MRGRYEAIWYVCNIKEIKMKNRVMALMGFVFPVILYAAQQDLPFGVEESFLSVRGGTVRILDISPKGQANPVHLLCIPGGPGGGSHGFFMGLCLKHLMGILCACMTR